MHRSIEAITPRAPSEHTPSARETWLIQRTAPRFDDFVRLMTKMMDDEREVYIEQPASEFNRGKVMAMRRVVHFLKTGETP